MEKVFKYKLFANNDERAIKIAIKLKSILKSHGVFEDEENFNLAIAIGGDGSFLRMVKACKFNTECFYLGVNAGTLGFLQEISPDKLEDFAERLVSGKYKIEEYGVQQTNVYANGGVSLFKSLNEIVVRDVNLNTARISVKINDVLLEKFSGDGLLISTSCGSTAYNLSFGGCIVYSVLHTLQITPIAPLNNNAYKTLRNSVIIPENAKITLVPYKEKTDYLISVDGENVSHLGVDKIETFISCDKIKCLRLFEYDYTKVINDKFL